jgi:nicotinate phosphoribosyltransferase
VEYDDQPMLKLSPGKATMAGRKQVYRRMDADGALRSDLIALAGEDAPPDGSRALLEPAIEQGRRVRPAPSLDETRERAASSFACLPAKYKVLRSPPEYPLEHTWALDELQWGLTQNLLAREMPSP